MDHSTSLISHKVSFHTFEGFFFHFAVCLIFLCCFTILFALQRKGGIGERKRKQDFVKAKHKKKDFKEIL